MNCGAGAHPEFFNGAGAADLAVIFMCDLEIV